MASKQTKRQAITLKGSTALVTDFFKYAVNTQVSSFSHDVVLMFLRIVSYSNAKFTPQMTFIW